MSRLKENNFSEHVKNLAGRSVGFRCCFPGCNRLLISRKENTSEILNIAEYAHIVAASPGGPYWKQWFDTLEMAIQTFFCA